jgi:UDP-glucose 4-epimerase
METFNVYLEARAKKRERKRLNNPLQSLVTYVLQHSQLSKPGLNILNGLLFLIGKTPGLRNVWPWTDPNKNSMTYLPIIKIEPRMPFTLPINESAGKVVNEIIPLQILHDFIDSASHHVISDKCFCRVAHDCKNFTPDVGCILMGETTEKLPPGLMRKVTKEEAHKHVEKAVKLGLVPVTGKVNFDNTGFLTPDTKKLLSVCLCCHCCCMMGYFKHTPANHLNKVFPAVEGISVEVTDGCKGCGTCIETCIFDAITIQNRKAVHSAQCRGCGRCVMNCPNKAASISINNPNYRQDVFNRIMSHIDLS